MNSYEELVCLFGFGLEPKATGPCFRIDFEKKLITMAPIPFDEWEKISSRRLKIVPPQDFDTRDAAIGCAREIDKIIAERGAA